MSENKGYVHPEAIVDAEWVQSHLTNPTVRLIEVDVDTKAYEQGHIPGAVGFNWQKELQDQVIRAPMSKEQLESLLSRVGVSDDTMVVFYGDNNNWFAAWAFWILRYYGHHDVRLLDGGRVKWLADKREITTTVPSYPHTNYIAQVPNRDIRAFETRFSVHLSMIFPYFCRVTKHEPVVQRQQGSHRLTMSGVCVDGRRRGSTQKSSVSPPKSCDRPVDARMQFPAILVKLSIMA